MSKREHIVRNGFTIIGHRWVPRANAYAILGARPNEHAPDGIEYVTSWMGDMTDSGWSQGHYTFDLVTAADDFKSRVGLDTSRNL